MTDAFPLDEISEIERHPENYRLLRKIPLEAGPLTLPYTVTSVHKLPELTAKAVFLDTETTGLNPECDRIIELSMIKTTISLSDPRILSIDEIYTAREDPGTVISPFITELTGLDSEKLRGKSFNEKQIRAFLSDTLLVIAHNARFDSAFFEKRFPELGSNAGTQMGWACTARDINWKGFGLNGFKLEYLLLKHGYFYNAHHAADDALADIFLMIVNSEAFAMLINGKISSL